MMWYCSLKNRNHEHHTTQHIRQGLMPLPLGTLLPSVATSYMLDPLYDMELLGGDWYEEVC